MVADGCHKLVRLIINCVKTVRAYNVLRRIDFKFNSCKAVLKI